MQRIFQMKKETIWKGQELLGAISVIEYNNNLIQGLINSGKTTLSGIIDSDIGAVALQEQLDRNNQRIEELEKQLDEL